MDNSSSGCVLVTGGSGLVGKALEEFVKVELRGKDNFRYVFVSSKDADLTNKEQTRALLAEHKPDYVINLAARVGGLYANMSDNESFCRVNTMINENVLFWSSHFNVKKCISCLSTCIFPDKVDYPLDESKIHLGPPHHSNWGYSMAKRQVDNLNRYYNELANGKQLFTAIVPTNVYGKFDNFSLENSHVVPGLIHRAYVSATSSKRQGLQSAPLKLCGTGKSMRQFIYAGDLAKLIVWTLKNYHDTEPLILCPDEMDEISIDQVASTICDVTGKLVGIDMFLLYDTSKSDGQYKKTASNMKLRRLYPEFQFTSFSAGINQAIEWFFQTYPNVRM